MNIDYSANWLVNLATQAGMSDLRFDEKGFCFLKLDEKIIVSIFRESEDILIICASKRMEHIKQKHHSLILRRNRGNLFNDRPILSIDILDNGVTYVEAIIKRDLSRDENVKLDSVINEINEINDLILQDDVPASATP